MSISRLRLPVPARRVRTASRRKRSASRKKTQHSPSRPCFISFRRSPALDITITVLWGTKNSTAARSLILIRPHTATGNQEQNQELKSGTSLLGFPEVTAWQGCPRRHDIIQSSKFPVLYYKSRPQDVLRQQNITRYSVWSDLWPGSLVVKVPGIYLIILMGPRFNSYCSHFFFTCTHNLYGSYSPWYFLCTEFSLLPCILFSIKQTIDQNLIDMCKVAGGHVDDLGPGVLICNTVQEIYYSALCHVA